MSNLMAVFKAEGKFAGYVVCFEDGMAYYQRGAPLNGTDPPMEFHENVMLALCERLAELQSLVDKARLLLERGAV